MYKLEVNLKQHTPLIHFHEQQGATLRASEVKPKLDKYLKFMLGINDNQIETTNKYKVWYQKGKESTAFDYRLQIYSDAGNPKLIPENNREDYPNFFGNMGADYSKNPKYISFTELPIRFILSSFNSAKIENESLLETINSIIPEFFLTHNFGTRQSKGYGSFYIHPDDSSYIDPHEVIKYQKVENPAFLRYSYKIEIDKTRTREDEKTYVLKTIETFYKAMRSGINVCWGRNQHYIKSWLWLYFTREFSRDKPIKWEKKKIKEQFLNGQETKAQIIKHQDKEDFESSPIGYKGSYELLIKDLFGLASEEKWSAKYDNYKIVKVIDGIDRFPSPVFFKPLKIGSAFTVFFHAIAIDEKNSILKKSVTINSSLVMQTPRRFDFHDFFDFLSSKSKFSLDNEFRFQVDEESVSVTQLKQERKNYFRSVENYRILNPIIDQLQNKINA